MVIRTPGASRSMPGPRFVPHHDSPSREVRVFISSHGFEAPTPSTCGRQAGKLTGPWSFPTAAASTQPRPPRPFVRARSKARVMTSVGGPPPHELEITSARPSSQHQSIASAVSSSEQESRTRCSMRG